MVHGYQPVHCKGEQGEDASGHSQVGGERVELTVCSPEHPHSEDKYFHNIFI